MDDPDLLARAIDAIDAANSDDPNIVTVRGRTGPKELLHADLVSEWVGRARRDASDALRLAARGHHFRRWTSPRTSYPPGRAGYLRWRRALHDQHARELGELLVATGYDDATIARVQSLVRKEGLGRPGASGTSAIADVQVLEDALCLTFLETQLSDVAARLEPDVLARVLDKTLAKMSPEGLALAGALPLDPGAAELLAAARTREVVTRYLDAMREHDWDGVRATLAPDVERMGPYRDFYRTRDGYGRFLQETITALRGYELVVHRMIGDGTTVTVELSETVDDGDGRLRTEEAVVFDVLGGLIERVAVYLQSSEHLGN